MGAYLLRWLTKDIIGGAIVAALITAGRSPSTPSPQVIAVAIVAGSVIGAAMAVMTWWSRRVMAGRDPWTVAALTLNWATLVLIDGVLLATWPELGAFAVALTVQAGAPLLAPSAVRAARWADRRWVRPRAGLDFRLSCGCTAGVLHTGEHEPGCRPVPPPRRPVPTRQ